jgi:hypothetical protein
MPHAWSPPTVIAEKVRPTATSVGMRQYLSQHHARPCSSSAHTPLPPTLIAENSGTAGRPRPTATFTGVEPIEIDGSGSYVLNP